MPTLLELISHHPAKSKEAAVAMLFAAYRAETAAVATVRPLKKAAAAKEKAST